MIECRAPSRSRPQRHRISKRPSRLAEAERRGDIGALEQLLVPEYEGYDPAGRSKDRASVLWAYREGEARIAALRPSELRATVVSDVGLVVGISALSGRQATATLPRTAP